MLVKEKPSYRLTIFPPPLEEAQDELMGPLFGGTVLSTAEGPEVTDPQPGFGSPLMSVDTAPRHPPHDQRQGFSSR